MEEIRAVMGDKVFDVIGQLLQLNNINFEDLIKEATYGKAEEEKAYETVEKLDPDKLKELEEATGIALATSHVDLSQVRKTKEQDFISEEKRLMPRYVEEFFARGCEYLGIKLEVRADGLWRIPYLKEEFRSPHLEASRNLGIAEKSYKKFTFYKEKLDEPSYVDAEFISPGHSLFGAIAERLDYKLAQTVGFQSALFSDADATHPYRLHFYQVEIIGQDIKGKETVIRAVMKAVLEETQGQYQLISTDCLHDFTPLDVESFEDLSPNNVMANNSEAIFFHFEHQEIASGDGKTTNQNLSENTPRNDHKCLLSPPTSEQQNEIEKWLKVNVQFPLKQEESQKRQRELEIRQDYLEKAMDAAIKDARSAYLKLASKVAKGDDSFRVARDKAQNKVDALKERYQNKKNQLTYLQIVRPGKIRYLGTALVIPTPNTVEPNMQSNAEVEAIAMEYVMNYERERGWTPTDVSQLRDGCGFDIRSIKDVEDDSSNVLVRRIEVKGRADFDQDICLTNNEWRRAQQLGDSYRLYVVWGCQSDSQQLITIQNPAVALAGKVKEVKQVTRYIIGGSTLAQLGITQ